MLPKTLQNKPAKRSEPTLKMNTWFCMCGQMENHVISRTLRLQQCARDNVGGDALRCVHFLYRSRRHRVAVEGKVASDASKN
jgi:hypothetical protein